MMTVFAPGDWVTGVFEHRHMASGVIQELICDGTARILWDDGTESTEKMKDFRHLVRRKNPVNPKSGVSD